MSRFVLEWLFVYWSYYWYQFKRSIDRFIITPYFTPKKFANACMLFGQFLFFRNKKVKGYPLKLSMDPTNLCMLRCPLCPTGRLDPARPGTIMPFDHFKHTIDEMAPYLYEIDLNNWGEPFSNKYIYDMIKYAHGKNIRTSVNSNLNVPWTEEQVRVLIANGLDILRASVDGIKQETYEQYRKAGKLEIVVNNLKLLKKIKTELNSKNPRVDWQYLVFKHNEHELPELSKFKEEIGADNLIIAPVRADLGKEIFLSDEQKVDSLKAYLPTDEKFSRYQYEEKKRKLRKKYCHFPWTVSVINASGSVSPCCGIYPEQADVGNAFKEGSMKAIWNNEKYQKSREIIARKTVDNSLICQNCIYTGFID